MTRRAATKGPSAEPQTISETAWYYEYPTHLEFIVECHSGEGYHQTLTVRVPIRLLKKSLERIDAC